MMDTKGKWGKRMPLKSHCSEWKLSHVLTQEGNEAHRGPLERIGAGKQGTLTLT